MKKHKKERQRKTRDVPDTDLAEYPADRIQHILHNSFYSSHWSRDVPDTDLAKYQADRIQHIVLNSFFLNGH